MIKKIVGNIIIFGILIMLVGTIAVRFIDIKTYVVDSPSMHPNIPKYSLVYINERPNKSRFAVGDVVAVKKGSLSYIHRITFIEGNMITTKGDRNDSNDTPVDISSVYGVVVISIPYLGYMFRSIYPAIILLGLILTYVIIKSIVKTIRKK